MYKGNLKSVVVLGFSAMFAGYAVADSGKNVANVSNDLISQLTSIVADNIKADAVDCATGNTDGTIGHSIKQAMAVHTELASATPNVESLFDVGNNCFSGLNNIFDLSPAIPTIGSILSVATNAIKQYAQKQVCSAVNQVSGMVTSPINQAINNVNGISSFSELNGLTNGLLGQVMPQINPSLGSGYHTPPSSTTYTIGTNPFNSTQTDFGGSVGESSNVNSMNPQSVNPLAMGTTITTADTTPTDNYYDSSDGEIGFIQSIGNLFNR